jgi:2'-5' RNA ligase
LTLLRLKSRDHVKSLIDWIREEGGPEDAGAFEVQSLHLYQSVLRPEGARYTRLRTVALK